MVTAKEITIPLAIAEILGDLTWKKRFDKLMEFLTLNDFIEQSNKFVAEINTQGFFERAKDPKIWKELSTRRLSLLTTIKPLTWEVANRIPSLLTFCDVTVKNSGVASPLCLFASSPVRQFASFDIVNLLTQQPANHRPTSTAASPLAPRFAYNSVSRIAQYAQRHTQDEKSAALPLGLCSVVIRVQIERHIANLIWLRDGSKNEMSSGILIGELSSIRDRNIMTDEELILRIKKFIEDYTSDEFKKRLATKEDIQEADDLINRVVEELRKSIKIDISHLFLAKSSLCPTPGNERKLTIENLKVYYEKEVTPEDRFTAGGIGWFSPLWFQAVKGLLARLRKKRYFKNVTSATDLGCGDGRLAIALATEQRIRRIVGLEIEGELVASSEKVHREFGDDCRIEFIKEDFLRVDLSGFDLYFYYAFGTRDWKSLGKKLIRSVSAGKLVVVCQYELDGLFNFLKENGFRQVDDFNLSFFIEDYGKRVTMSFGILQQTSNLDRARRSSSPLEPAAASPLAKENHSNSNREVNGLLKDLSIGSIATMETLSATEPSESMRKRIVVLQLPTLELPILKYITVPFCDSEGRLRSEPSNKVETIELSDIIQGKIVLRREPFQKRDSIVKYGNILQFAFKGKTIRATVIGAGMHNFFLVSHEKISNKLEGFAGHGLRWGIGEVERGVLDGTIKIIDSNSAAASPLALGVSYLQRREGLNGSLPVDKKRSASPLAFGSSITGRSMPEALLKKELGCRNYKPKSPQEELKEAEEIYREVLESLYQEFMPLIENNISHVHRWLHQIVVASEFLWLPSTYQYGFDLLENAYAKAGDYVSQADYWRVVTTVIEVMGQHPELRECACQLIGASKTYQGGYRQYSAGHHQRVLCKGLNLNRDDLEFRRLLLLSILSGIGNDNPGLSLALLQEYEEITQSLFKSGFNDSLFKYWKRDQELACVGPAITVWEILAEIPDTAQKILTMAKNLDIQKGNNSKCLELIIKRLKISGLLVRFQEQVRLVIKNLPRQEKDKFYEMLQPDYKWRLGYEGELMRKMRSAVERKDWDYLCSVAHDFLLNVEFKTAEDFASDPCLGEGAFKFGQRTAYGEPIFTLAHVLAELDQYVGLAGKAYLKAAEIGFGMYGMFHLEKSIASVIRSLEIRYVLPYLIKSAMKTIGLTSHGSKQRLILSGLRRLYPLILRDLSWQPAGKIVHCIAAPITVDSAGKAGKGDVSILDKGSLSEREVPDNWTTNNSASPLAHYKIPSFLAQKIPNNNSYREGYYCCASPLTDVPLHNENSEKPSEEDLQKKFELVTQRIIKAFRISFPNFSKIEITSLLLRNSKTAYARLRGIKRMKYEVSVGDRYILGDDDKEGILVALMAHEIGHLPTEKIEKRKDFLRSILCILLAFGTLVFWGILICSLSGLIIYVVNCILTARINEKRQLIADKNALRLLRTAGYKEEELVHLLDMAYFDLMPEAILMRAAYLKRRECLISRIPTGFEDPNSSSGEGAASPLMNNDSSGASSPIDKGARKVLKAARQKNSSRNPTMKQLFEWLNSCNPEDEKKLHQAIERNPKLLDKLVEICDSKEGPSARELQSSLKNLISDLANKERNPQRKSLLYFYLGKLMKTSLFGDSFELLIQAQPIQLKELYLIYVLSFELDNKNMQARLALIDMALTVGESEYAYELFDGIPKKYRNTPNYKSIEGLIELHKGHAEKAAESMLSTYWLIPKEDGKGKITRLMDLAMLHFFLGDKEEMISALIGAYQLLKGMAPDKRSKQLKYLAQLERLADILGIGVDFETLIQQRRGTGSSPVVNKNTNLFASKSILVPDLWEKLSKFIDRINDILKQLQNIAVELEIDNRVYVMLAGNHHSTQKHLHSKDIRQFTREFLNYYKEETERLSRDFKIYANRQKKSLIPEAKQYLAALTNIITEEALIILQANGWNLNKFRQTVRFVLPDKRMSLWNVMLYFGLTGAFKEEAEKRLKANRTIKETAGTFGIKDAAEFGSWLRALGIDIRKQRKNRAMRVHDSTRAASSPLGTDVTNFMIEFCKGIIDELTGLINLPQSAPRTEAEAHIHRYQHYIELSKLYLLRRDYDVVRALDFCKKAEHDFNTSIKLCPGYEGATRIKEELEMQLVKAHFLQRISKNLFLSFQQVIQQIEVLTKGPILQKEFVAEMLKGFINAGIAQLSVDKKGIYFLSPDVSSWLGGALSEQRPKGSSPVSGASGVLPPQPVIPFKIKVRLENGHYSFEKDLSPQIKEIAHKVIPEAEFNRLIKEKKWYNPLAPPRELTLACTLNPDFENPSQQKSLSVKFIRAPEISLGERFSWVALHLSVILPNEQVDSNVFLGELFSVRPARSMPPKIPTWIVKRYIRQDNNGFIKMEDGPCVLYPDGTYWDWRDINPEFYLNKLRAWQKSSGQSLNGWSIYFRHLRRFMPADAVVSVILKEKVIIVYIKNNQWQDALYSAILSKAFILINPHRFILYPFYPESLRSRARLFMRLGQAEECREDKGAAILIEQFTQKAKRLDGSYVGKEKRSFLLFKKAKLAYLNLRIAYIWQRRQFFEQCGPLAAIRALGRCLSTRGKAKLRGYSLVKRGSAGIKLIIILSVAAMILLLRPTIAWPVENRQMENGSGTISGSAASPLAFGSPVRQFASSNRPIGQSFDRLRTLRRRTLSESEVPVNRLINNSASPLWAASPFIKKKVIMNLLKITQREEFSEAYFETAMIFADAILSLSDVNKIMLVGDSAMYLPLILILQGRDITFVEYSEYKVRELMKLKENFEEVLVRSGMKRSLQLQGINEEFGALDIKKHRLEKGSFDLITLIDLVGRYVRGEPRHWLLKAKELLKPKAYLIIDERATTMAGETIMDCLSIIFPNCQRLYRPEIVFQGDYKYEDVSNIPFISRNGFYSVVNPAGSPLANKNRDVPDYFYPLVNGIGWVLVGADNEEWLSVSMNRKIYVQMTQLFDWYPLSYIKDFYPEEPAFFINIYKYSITEFKSFFNFASLELDIQRICLLIESDFHLYLLKIISGDNYYFSIKFFIDDFERLGSEISSRDKAAFETRQYFIRVYDSFFYLLFGKPSLIYPNISMLCIKEFHKEEYNIILTICQADITAAASPLALGGSYPQRRGGLNGSLLEEDQDVLSSPLSNKHLQNKSGSPIARSALHISHGAFSKKTHAASPLAFGSPVCQFASSNRPIGQSFDKLRTLRRRPLSESEVPVNRPTNRSASPLASSVSSSSPLKQLFLADRTGHSMVWRDRPAISLFVKRVEFQRDAQKLLEALNNEKVPIGGVLKWAIPNVEEAVKEKPVEWFRMAMRLGLELIEREGILPCPVLALGVPPAVSFSEGRIKKYKKNLYELKSWTVAVNSKTRQEMLEMYASSWKYTSERAVESVLRKEVYERVKTLLGRICIEAPDRQGDFKKLLENKRSASPLARASSTTKASYLFSRNELFPGQLNIFEDSTQKAPTQFLTFVKWDNSTASIGMAEKNMTTFLADRGKAELFKNADGNGGLKWRDTTHSIQRFPAGLQIQEERGVLLQGIAILPLLSAAIEPARFLLVYGILLMPEQYQQVRRLHHAQLTPETHVFSLKSSFILNITIDPEKSQEPAQPTAASPLAFGSRVLGFSCSRELAVQVTGLFFNPTTNSRTHELTNYNTGASQLAERKHSSNWLKKRPSIGSRVVKPVVNADGLRDKLWIGGDGNLDKLPPTVLLNRGLHSFGNLGSEISFPALMTNPSWNVLENVELIFPPEINLDFICFDCASTIRTIAILVFSHLITPSSLFRINPFRHFGNVDSDNTQPARGHDSTYYMYRSLIRIPQDQTARPSGVIRIPLNNLSIINNLFNISNGDILLVPFSLSVEANFVFVRLNTFTKFLNVHIANNNIKLLSCQIKPFCSFSLLYDSAASPLLQVPGAGCEEQGLPSTQPPAPGTIYNSASPLAFGSPISQFASSPVGEFDNSAFNWQTGKPANRPIDTAASPLAFGSPISQFASSPISQFASSKRPTGQSFDRLRTLPRRTLSESEVPANRPTNNSASPLAAEEQFYRSSSSPHMLDRNGVNDFSLFVKDFLSRIQEIGKEQRLDRKDLVSAAKINERDFADWEKGKGAFSFFKYGFMSLINSLNLREDQRVGQLLKLGFDKILNPPERSRTRKYQKIDRALRCLRAIDAGLKSGMVSETPEGFVLAKKPNLNTLSWIEKEILYAVFPEYRVFITSLWKGVVRFRNKNPNRPITEGELKYLSHMGEKALMVMQKMIEVDSDNRVGCEVGKRSASPLAFGSPISQFASSPISQFASSKRPTGQSFDRLRTLRRRTLSESEVPANRPTNNSASPLEEELPLVYLWNGTTKRFNKHRAVVYDGTEKRFSKVKNALRHWIPYESEGFGIDRVKERATGKIIEIPGIKANAREIIKGNIAKQERFMVFEAMKGLAGIVALARFEINSEGILVTTFIVSPQIRRDKRYLNETIIMAALNSLCEFSKKSFGSTKVWIAPGNQDVTDYLLKFEPRQKEGKLFFDDAAAERCFDYMVSRRSELIDLSFEGRKPIEVGLHNVKRFEAEKAFKEKNEFFRRFFESQENEKNKVQVHVQQMNSVNGQTFIAVIGDKNDEDFMDKARSVVPEGRIWWFFALRKDLVIDISGNKIRAYSGSEGKRSFMLKAFVKKSLKALAGQNKEKTSLAIAEEYINENGKKVRVVLKGLTGAPLLLKRLIERKKEALLTLGDTQICIKHHRIKITPSSLASKKPDDETIKAIKEVRKCLNKILIYYIISDIHLADYFDGEKARQLLGLLEKIEAEGSQLIIDGDLLDLWRAKFGHIKRIHAKVLEKLDSLAAKDQLEYIVGNHDKPLRTNRKLRKAFEKEYPHIKISDFFWDQEAGLYVEHGAKPDIWNDLIYRVGLVVTWVIGSIERIARSKIVKFISPNLAEKIDPFLTKWKNAILPTEALVRQEVIYPFQRIFVIAELYAPDVKVICFGHTHQLVKPREGWINHLLNHAYGFRKLEYVNCGRWPGLMPQSESRNEWKKKKGLKVDELPLPEKKEPQPSGDIIVYSRLSKRIKVTNSRKIAETFGRGLSLQANGRLAQACSASPLAWIGSPLADGVSLRKVGAVVGFNGTSIELLRGVEMGMPRKEEDFLTGLMVP
ncbi:MAG: metallophosphoesterase [Candidatus Omnitrophota bacterium]